MDKYRKGIITGFLGILICFSLMAAITYDKVYVVQAKGATSTLNSAISASVTAANCTAVDLQNYESGILELIRISGTTGISVQPQTLNSSTGTYVTPYTFAPGGVSGSNTWTAYPACTGTTASKSFIVTGLKGRYWKFVPTLTGTTSWTVKFTPCPN